MELYSLILLSPRKYFLQALDETLNFGLVDEYGLYLLFL
jgi:hypothetical protein